MSILFKNIKELVQVRPEPITFVSGDEGLTHNKKCVFTN